jgi:hypothetical protein
MASVSFKGNIKQVQKEMQRMAKPAVQRATVRALNKTVTTVRAKTLREMQSQSQLPNQKHLRKNVTKHNAHKAKLWARVAAKSVAIPLSEWKHKQTDYGVTVAVWGKALHIKGAFVATMGSGHKGIFTRTSRFARAGNPRYEDDEARFYGAMPREYRLPIREAYGPAPSAVMISKAIERAQTAAATEKFTPAFMHELRREIAKS